MMSSGGSMAVLVSGGVDSSVALRLLHAAGHRCTAFYLKIWFQVHTPPPISIFCNVKPRDLLRS